MLNYNWYSTLPTGWLVTKYIIINLTLSDQDVLLCKAVS